MHSLDGANLHTLHEAEESEEAEASDESSADVCVHNLPCLEGCYAVAFCLDCSSKSGSSIIALQSINRRLIDSGAAMSEQGKNSRRLEGLSD